MFKHHAGKTYRGVKVKVYTYLTSSLGEISGHFHPPSGLTPVIMKWETSCTLETGEAQRRIDVCS